MHAVGVVDDATSRLMYLQFVAAETTFNYFAAARSYLTQFGRGSARAPWQTLYPAQVGDISTLRIWVTFQLRVYNGRKGIDVSTGVLYFEAARL